MTDTDRQENQDTDEREGENGEAKADGLGAFLRSERTKKGLSCEQVARITRFRTQIIESLEKEEWENLPPPVFVKGFIRAYSVALGIEKEKVLDLVKKTESLKTMAPKPLIEPKRAKKRRTFLALLLLCIACIVLYLWRTNPSLLRWVRVSQEVVQPNPVREEQRLALEAVQTPSREPSVSSEMPVPLREAAEEKPEIVEKAAPLIEESLVPPPEEVASLQPESLEAQVETEEYVLKAIVTERTWVKIYLDDRDPREYILQPGSQLQWKATAGFNIVIGNAAGIEFEFNGKAIEKLGKTGQVMRLSLPEGFRSKKYEE